VVQASEAVNELVRVGAVMPSSLDRAGVEIVVYEAVDDMPVGRRFVAHWFDRHGALQVATAVGPTEDYCRERLTTFLVCQIVKASVVLGDSDAARRNQARTAKARAARAAKLAKARARGHG
jgi:hypothetical protein